MQSFTRVYLSIYHASRKASDLQSLGGAKIVGLRLDTGGITCRSVLQLYSEHCFSLIRAAAKHPNFLPGVYFSPRRFVLWKVFVASSRQGV